MTNQLSFAHSNAKTVVHLWYDQPDLNSARTYCHAALEVENDICRSYVSYWEDNSLEGHSQNCPKKPHFHLNYETDLSLLKGKFHKRYILYSLNIEKITKAFERFKKSPSRWGSLGWRYWGRSYPQNASGVVGYLLDKGGIFNHINTKPNDMPITLLKATLVPIAFSALILHHLRPYKNPSREINLIDLRRCGDLLRLGAINAATGYDYLLTRIQANAGYFCSQDNTSNAELGCELNRTREILWPTRNLYYKYYQDGNEVQTYEAANLIHEVFTSIRKVVYGILFTGGIFNGLAFLSRLYLSRKFDGRDVSVMTKRMQKVEIKNERLHNAALNPSEIRFLDIYPWDVRNLGLSSTI